MGTERSTEFDGPCRCGAGTFHIDDCSPDHGWQTATPQWYEAFIRCPQCSQQYDLVRRGKRFVLVDRAEIVAVEVRRDAARVAAQALMTRPDVTIALSNYAAHLNGLPSIAAIHRQLVADGFMPNSIATFRKGWRGASDWVQTRARPRHLPTIFAVFGLSTDALNASLHELDQRDAAAAAEPQPVGEPVYEL